MFDAVDNCLAKYTQFKGRAARSEYWDFTLFTLIVELFALITRIGAIQHFVNIAFLLPTLAVGFDVCTTSAGAAGGSCSTPCRSSARSSFSYGLPSRRMQKTPTDQSPPVSRLRPRARHTDMVALTIEKSVHVSRPVCGRGLGVLARKSNL